MPESNYSDFTKAPFPRKDFTNNWNDAIAAIRQTRDAYASNFPRGFGPLAKLRRGLMVRDIFIGKTTTTGPKGSEKDYTDARYWITREVPDPSMTATNGIITDLLKIIDDPIAPANGLPLIVTGVNEKELLYDANKPFGTHVLAKGTPVLVTGISLQQGDGTIAYVFSRNPIWMFNLTASATRPGTYKGRLFSAPITTSDVTSGSAIGPADFGVDPGSDNAYAFNVREQGQSTHDLDSGGSFLPLVFPCSPPISLATTDDKPVVLINADQWENCS